MRNSKIAAAAVCAACLPAALVAGRPTASLGSPKTPPPYSFEDGRLVLAPGSSLRASLQIVAAGEAAGESRAYRAVAQILALSNASGNLTGDRTGWVELDPKLSASAGLRLDGKDVPGTAYGLATLPVELAVRVKAGQRLEIARYGLEKPRVPGRVVRIVARPGGEDRADVVFRFENAQDWFPGTNCEASFPFLTGRPVRIPTTAPIHEGTAEYVWKEVAPGRFEARSVSFVDSSPEEADVLGLKPGDRIAARGAILLKPLLRRVLAHRKG